MQYAIKLEDLGGEYIATCRDVPEFATVGDDVESALFYAVEAMELTLSGYVDGRRPIPVPSQSRRGEYLVALPVLTVAKLGLFTAMLDNGVSKVSLVRLLGVHVPQVDRLLDVTRGSKIEAIEHALSLLGRCMVIDVRKASRNEPSRENLYTCEKACEVLAGQIHFTLTRNQLQRFNDLLEIPLCDPEALLCLLHTPSSWGR